MSYSRRQLEALGEPFGSCATRVKPGGYGRIYGLGNDPTGGGPAIPVIGGTPDPFGYSGPAAAAPVGTPDPLGYAGPAAAAPVGIPDPFGYGAAPTTPAATTSGGGGAATTTAAPTVEQQTTQLLQERLGTAPTQGQVNYWSGIFGQDNQVTPDEVARLNNAFANAGVTPAGGTTTGTTTGTTVGGNPIATNAPVITFVGDPNSQAAINAATAGPPIPTTQPPVVVPPPTSGGTGQGTVTTSPGGFLGNRPTGTALYNPFYAGPDARSDLVNMAYQRLLNRQPDPGGLASYSQEMIKGLTGQGLVSALANSPEFQRTQDFQRAYTSTFRPGYQEFGPSGQYNQPIYLGNYTNYARSAEPAQPLYNTTMMTPQDLGYGFGSFNPFAYGGTNPFASEAAAPASPSGSSTAAARGGRIKNDEGIAALLKR